MSITIIREADSLSYAAQRKARVAEILARHSQNLFGHSAASIGEIRTESIKRRLEAVFNK